jgi:hypothetical protein
VDALERAAGMMDGVLDLDSHLYFSTLMASLELHNLGENHFIPYCPSFLF